MSRRTTLVATSPASRHMRAAARSKGAPRAPAPPRSGKPHSGRPMDPAAPHLHWRGACGCAEAPEQEHPLGMRRPIRGLLGLLGRHAAHVAGSPPACGGGHRPVSQRRHRPTCRTGPQHRWHGSRVPLAMPGLHYPLWEILVGGGRHPRPGDPLRGWQRWRRPVWTQWRLRAFSVTSIRHLAPSLCHKRSPPIASGKCARCIASVSSVWGTSLANKSARHRATAASCLRAHSCVVWGGRTRSMRSQ